MVGSVDVMSISPPPPPLLRRHSVLKMLEKNFPPSLSSMRAFYSSVLGGICVDPELFCIPVDDHMVHRGHAVFDTCNVKAGRAYGLTFHVSWLSPCRTCTVPSGGSSCAQPPSLPPIICPWLSSWTACFGRLNLHVFIILTLGKSCGTSYSTLSGLQGSRRVYLSGTGSRQVEVTSG